MFAPGSEEVVSVSTVITGNANMEISQEIQRILEKYNLEQVFDAYIISLKTVEVKEISHSIQYQS